MKTCQDRVRLEEEVPSFNARSKRISTIKLPIYSRRKLILSLALIALQIQFNSAQKLYKSHNPPQNLVIPHIKYGQGLNRWSFLSVEKNNHGLYSNLLCPNPITSSTSPPRAKQDRQDKQRRKEQKEQRFNQQQTNKQTLPNEIWAVKTEEVVSQLPCSLRQYSVPQFNSNQGNLVMNTGSNQGSTRHNNGQFIENRILLVNVSLVPFNFHGAMPCSKYIKLMYDEEEGTSLRCRDIPFDNSHDTNYHINWPENKMQRKDYFSVMENLEMFLKNERSFRRQFYFQVYFTSLNGKNKRCIVQQYELDLSFPSGNSRYCNLTQTAQGFDELCGEFHCDDLIFPLYADPQPHSSREGGKGKPVSQEYDDDYEEEDLKHDLHNNQRSHHPKLNVGVGLGVGVGVNDGQNSMQTLNSENFSWSRMLRLDLRLLIFITVVPLVLFGVLVFGLELIIYFMCCRKRRDEDGEGGERSNQLLQNSLNVWENVPRQDAARTVSFSPMTTNIYGERKNMQMMDAASLESQETPKILKSALKKHGEHSSPIQHGHHYFEYDHDMPPSYIETTLR